MAYAVRNDLVEAWGEDAVTRLSVRDEDPDGSVTVQRALDHASAIMDARLSVRFALPISSVVLVAVCVDMAIARLATTADVMTDDIRKRGSEAEATLSKIADGRMNLGLAALGPSDSPRPIVGPGGAKIFNDRARGL